MSFYLALSKPQEQEGREHSVEQRGLRLNIYRSLCSQFPQGPRFLCSNVPCFKGLIFSEPYVPVVLFPQVPLLQGFYIPRFLCSSGPMLQGSYIPKFQCSNGPIFPGYCSKFPMFRLPYVTKVLSSHLLMFSLPYITRVLYSLTLVLQGSSVLSLMFQLTCVPRLLYSQVPMLQGSCVLFPSLLFC